MIDPNVASRLTTVPLLKLSSLNNLLPDLSLYDSSRPNVPQQVRISHTISSLLLTTYHRRTSQKPDEELITKFKKTFPDVSSTGSMSDGRLTGSINPAAVDGGISGPYVSLVFPKCSSFKVMLIVRSPDPMTMRSRSTIQLQGTFKTSDSHHP